MSYRHFDHRRCTTARRPRSGRSGGRSRSRFAVLVCALLLLAVYVGLSSRDRRGAAVGDPRASEEAHERIAWDPPEHVPPRLGGATLDGRDPIHPYAGSYRVPVLMYHEIGRPQSGLTVSPEMLGSQVKCLYESGYSSLPMDTLLRALHGEPVRLPAKAVVFTFDDGYIGVYTQAFPTLRDYGFTATVYVIPDLVGRAGYMTWEQIREMSDAGFTIGSHTMAHHDLRIVSREELFVDVADSRRVIRENTGQSIGSFCYPAGKYNRDVVDAVEEAGYLGAFTTEPGIVSLRDAPLVLGRVRVDGRESLETFRAKIPGL